MIKGILELAQELNVGKNIILRAAIDLKLIEPLDKSLKTIKFNKSQASLIKSKVLTFNKKINWPKISRKHSESSNFKDISDMWNLDLPPKQIDYNYTMLDLFSGAGGVTLGFVSTGFKPLLNFDIFKEANLTYEYNFKERLNIVNHSIIERSITDKEKISKELKGIKEEITLVVGGFPCQGFSVSGIRSISDSRNRLFLDMIDIIKSKKPKIVVMENVQGLLSMLTPDGKEFVIDEIIDSLTKIGYKADYAILNAANYYVPQQRKRVVIIANNIGVENIFPKPLLTEKEYISTKIVLSQFENIAEDYEFNHIFTNHKNETIEKMKHLKYGENLFASYSDGWKKTNPDLPSCTIKENHGGVNIHYNKNRVLTPRELAALQSFPNDFIFKGNKSKQLVQIGNAVPPLLAKAISLAVKKMLEVFNDQKKNTN